MYNAKLISLEGLDSSGKSTQVKLIKKYFEKNNLKYAHIHFPVYDHNEASNVIAAYLRGEYGNIDKVNPVFIANIYAMDRFLYLPELQKQLMENDVVLLDRYVFSNIAFQGAKYINDARSKIIREWIDEFEFGFLELPYPDLIIFFDVPISVIEDRLKENRNGNDREYLDGEIDIHEADIEFQKRVRKNYLELKDYENFEIINCARIVMDENFKVENLKIYTPEELFAKYENLLVKLMIIK